MKKTLIALFAGLLAFTACDWGNTVPEASAAPSQDKNNGAERYYRDGLYNLVGKYGRISLKKGDYVDDVYPAFSSGKDNVKVERYWRYDIDDLRKDLERAGITITGYYSTSNIFEMCWLTFDPREIVEMYIDVRRPEPYTELIQEDHLVAYAFEVKNNSRRIISGSVNWIRIYHNYESTLGNIAIISMGGPLAAKRLVDNFKKNGVEATIGPINNGKWYSEKEIRILTSDFNSIGVKK